MKTTIIINLLFQSINELKKKKDESVTQIWYTKKIVFRFFEDKLLLFKLLPSDYYLSRMSQLGCQDFTVTKDKMRNPSKAKAPCEFFLALQD